MRMVVSIPVHEKPEVINDQIENINKNLHDVAIVLHISKGFYDKYDEDKIKKCSNLFINPQHLVTNWGGIFKTHLSNFMFAKENVKFDYFLLQASNDMFVKKGLEEYVIKYDAGFNRRFVYKNSMWWPAACALNDEYLNKVRSINGITRIVASQIEGSFYKEEIFSYIVDVLKSAGLDDELFLSPKYPREEVYFSTIASNVVDYDRCGYPTTFSEVHRFDREIWSIRRKVDFLYRNVLKLFVSNQTNERIKGKLNDLLFKSKTYRIREKDILAICNKDLNYLRKYFVLDDNPGYFRLYDGNLFSVKRVERVYNDSVRTFIRNLEK